MTLKVFHLAAVCSPCMKETKFWIHFERLIIFVFPTDFILSSAYSLRRILIDHVKYEIFFIICETWNFSLYFNLLRFSSQCLDMHIFLFSLFFTSLMISFTHILCLYNIQLISIYFDSTIVIILNYLSVISLMSSRHRFIVCLTNPNGLYVFSFFYF